jgi:hypothetical protein
MNVAYEVCFADLPENYKSLFGVTWEVVFLAIRIKRSKLPCTRLGFDTKRRPSINRGLFYKIPAAIGVCTFPLLFKLTEC